MLGAHGTAFRPTISGEDIDAEIRGADVTRHVSLVAQMPGIRAWVNDQIRALARRLRDRGGWARHWDRRLPARGAQSLSGGGPVGARAAAAESSASIAARPRPRLRRRPTGWCSAMRGTRRRPCRRRDAILIDTTMLTQEEQVSSHRGTCRRGARPRTGLRRGGRGVSPDTAVTSPPVRH